jgi:hypothetical protein
MQDVLNMQRLLASNRSKQSICESTMSDITRRIQEALNTQAQESVQKAQEAQKKADLINNVLKAIGCLIAVVTFVVTFVFVGPVAALMSLAVFALCQTGAIDKLTDKILSSLNVSDPTVRLIVKLAIIVTVSILSGSISGIADTMLANGAAVMTGTMVKTVGAEIVMNAVQLTLCSGASADIAKVIAEKAAPDDEEKKQEIEMWLTLAFSVLLIIANITIMFKVMPSIVKNGVNIGLKVESLAAKDWSGYAAGSARETFFKGLKSVYDNVRNAKLPLAVQLTGQAGAVGFGAWGGFCMLDKAGYLADLAPVQAGQALVAHVMELINKTMQQENESLKGWFKALTASNHCWGDALRFEQVAAQLLA